MRTVNFHEATTHLSNLVDRAVKGEPFVIAKAGKPLVKVAALDAPAAPRRLHFLAGEIAVSDDFDRMGDAEIAALLRGRAVKLRSEGFLLLTTDAHLARYPGSVRQV